jgi:hypothetical protein
LQWQAAQAQEQAASQGREASLLQREEQADITERRVLREQLARLQTDVHREQRELTRARAERRSDQVTIERLERQRKQLQDRLDRFKSEAVSPDEIAALQRDIQELNESITAAMHGMKLD